jgi:DNA-binding response OmpR family regulator
VSHYRELGAEDVIPKPFDPLALSERVRSIWGGLRTRRGEEGGAEALAS